MAGAITYEALSQKSEADLENELMEQVLDKLHDMPYQDFIQTAASILNVDVVDIQEAFMRAGRFE